MDIGKKKVDSKVIEQGGWVGEKHGTPIAGWGDLCLKVRGFDCADLKAFNALESAALTESDRVDGQLTAEANERITTKGLVEVVLLDWQNLVEDGKPVTYSAKQAARYLSDPDYREFRSAVMDASILVGRIRGKQTEVDAKN